MTCLYVKDSLASSELCSEDTDEEPCEEFLDHKE